MEEFYSLNDYIQNHAQELLEEGNKFFEQSKYEDAIHYYKSLYNLSHLPEQAVEHIKSIAEYYLHEECKLPDEDTLLTLGDLLLEFPPPYSFPDKERADLAYGIYDMISDLPDDREIWIDFYLDHHPDLSDLSFAFPPVPAGPILII